MEKLGHKYKASILVADDEPYFLESLFDVLEDENYKVTTVKDGYEALEILKRVGFDILLVDIKMPGIDGFAVIDKAKQINPSMEVIIITAYPELDSAVKAIKKDVSDYLMKPISMEKLFNAISRALQRRSSKVLLKEQQDRLNQMTQELDKVKQALSEVSKKVLLGQVGLGLFHEIKNFLGIMNLSCYYLKKNIDTKDEKICKHLNIIQIQIENSNQIAIKLLDFMKKENTKEQKLYNPNRIVEDVVGLVEHQLNLKSIKIVTKLETNIPQILVNPVQMKHVFLNMILNAENAMPDGGILRITTRNLMEECPKTKIEFQDSGCGINEEDKKNLFEPFFSENEKKDGIGLGLWVSNEIIKSYSGSIDFESETGKGTTFFITLPVEKKE